MYSSKFHVLLLAAVLCACGSAPDEAAPEQPSSFLDELALRTPRDLDPDPHVLELELEARVSQVSIVPGTTTPVWTYDGAIPGPLLRAKVGVPLVVHVKN